MPQPNTPRGLRRPSATDRLTDAWDHISDLADDVDAYLGTDWVVAGFVAAAGWSNTACRGRRFGPLVILELILTRTGVALNSPATGDMANTQILTAVPAALRPTVNSRPFQWIVDSATDGGGALNSAGVASIYSMNSTATIPVGGILSATVVFGLDGF
jgi:hypothetical protein